MQHFFLYPRESKRIVGRIAFDKYPSRTRYYATVGETVQGAFCTLLQDSPSRAIEAGRQLSRTIMEG